MLAQKQDVIQEYCKALDRNDIPTFEAILRQAQQNDDLETAIATLHLQFDPMEDFTTQLLRTRNEVRG